MEENGRMSDSMNRPHGLVIGTAGHIDHGKTSLVRALTGMDTDRLAEEKRRGISIDLGFAHYKLPNGRSISFIDVPGHERFIKNMLAGVGGIGAVMLIVAADDSVMPQTREHFEICRLLGIRYGFVALTKVDLATAEQVARVRKDVLDMAAGSFLQGSPIVEVSSVTGHGLSDVIQQLSILSEKAVPSESQKLARLPIDRSFTLTGFGTVITGTLLSGRFCVGEHIRLHPGRKEARIRGIQVQGLQVDQACSGQRTAINLAGIESTEIRRGFVLTHVDELEGTKVIDCSIEWLEGAKKSSRREQVLYHAGTAEIVADLKVLAPGIARVWLSEATLALPGDRFIIRQPSPERTIAGGMIIDCFPPVRLNRLKSLARLQSFGQSAPRARIEFLVEESSNGLTLGNLVRSTGFRGEQIAELVRLNANLFLHVPTQRAFSKKWLGARRAEVTEWLQAFHAENPSAIGAPISAARLGLEPELAAVVFDGLPGVRVQGEVIALATHRASFNDQESAALNKIETAFRQAGYQPPGVADVLKSATPDSKRGRALLELLVKSKKLVRISEDIVFHSEVITHVRSSLSVHKGRRFSVPEFKEWTQMSRKYAIPVLEYLDRERVTRRDGDARVIV